MVGIITFLNVPSHFRKKKFTLILRYDFFKFFNFFAQNTKFLQNDLFLRIPIKNIDSKKIKT